MALNLGRRPKELSWRAVTSPGWAVKRMDVCRSYAARREMASPDLRPRVLAESAVNVDIVPLMASPPWLHTRFLFFLFCLPFPLLL